MELEEELKNIKNNLAKQIEIHENEKREAEQLLNEQKEQLKKVNDEERVKINQLVSCFFFLYTCLVFQTTFSTLKKIIWFYNVTDRRTRRNWKETCSSSHQCWNFNTNLKSKQ